MTQRHELRWGGFAGLAFLGNPLPPETLLPLLCGAVGDHAELAGEAHAGDRPGRRHVLAAFPVRVAPDHLPLQRP